MPREDDEHDPREDEVDARADGKQRGGEKDEAKRGGAGGGEGDARRMLLTSKQGDDARRSLRFLSFAKPRLIFGFEHLSPAFVPTMSSKCRGISLCLEGVRGWQPPAKLLEDSDSDGTEVTVRLSLSMFHLGSGTFFGSTWMGAPITINGEGEGRLHRVLDFTYEDVVYLISRINDPKCIGVLEIVASKEDRARNITVAQYGCGWTMLNIFASPIPPDISEGAENLKTTVT